jgi:hypothetical protein
VIHRVTRVTRVIRFIRLLSYRVIRDFKVWGLLKVMRQRSFILQAQVTNMQHM